MHSPTAEQLLARALFEIRVLLSSHIGGHSSAGPEVRSAAELAYALHNAALAVSEGLPCSTTTVIEALQRADSVTGEQFTHRFASPGGS